MLELSIVQEVGGRRLEVDAVGRERVHADGQRAGAGERAQSDAPGEPLESALMLTA